MGRPGSRSGPQKLELRADAELAGWVRRYAARRRVSVSALLRQAVVNFRDDCQRGTPEIVEREKPDKLDRRPDRELVGARPSKPAPERVQGRLSLLGALVERGCRQEAAARAIRLGRVTVDGRVVTDCTALVDPETVRRAA